MNRTLNTGITIAIVTIWAAITVFGIVTLISPAWLEELSNPGMNAEAMTKKHAADVLLKKGEPEKAIPLYKSAIKIVPDYRAAVANLAVAYQKTRNYQLAVITFKYLLGNNPEHPDVLYHNLAEIEEKMGNIPEAIQYYLLAAEHAPYPEKAWQMAGKLSLNEEKWADAITYFQKAIGTRMTIENAYQGMVATEVQSRNDSLRFNHDLPANYLEIYDLSVFNYMLQHDVNQARTYNNLGFCQAKMGHYDEAIAHFRQALKIDPNFRDALNNMEAVQQLKSSTESNLR